MKRFTVTDEHLKLLRRANVRWEDCEFGAPAIDCKRPYGNSDVVGDIIEILGWPFAGEDQTDDNAFTTKARAIHAETETVLQIALSVGYFKAGMYIADDYRDNWRLAV